MVPNPKKNFINLKQSVTVTDKNYVANRKTSSLKYKKTFQIKSPSKPKKLKHLQKPRNKRKNLTSKREISHNEHINKKYIPLLRNIGMLFDNILSSDSSETIDSRRYNKYKRNPVQSDSDDVVCTCVSKYESAIRSNADQETTSTAFPTEVETETFTSITVTTPSAYHTTDDHISRFGWNKNLSVLPTRNSVSLRRNNHRFRERSSSTYNRSVEGYFTGNHGDNEYTTLRRENDSDAEYNKEDTNSNTRNDASGDRSGGRGYRTYPGDSEADRRTDESEELVFPTNETFKSNTGHVFEHEGETQFEIRRNKTKSSILLPKFTSGLRGIKPEKENTSLRAAETNEKSVELDYAGNKRFTVRDGAVASENQEISRTNKAVNPRNSLSNSTFPGKVVMIFDGYSVARDVNGENKLTEKAIHIHS